MNSELHKKVLADLMKAGIGSEMHALQIFKNRDWYVTGSSSYYDLDNHCLREIDLVACYSILDFENRCHSFMRVCVEVKKTETIKIGDLVIHEGRHEIRVEGEVVNLTLTEFRILHLIAQKPGWVFTRSQIVDAVRGTDYPVTDRSVDVQIVGLRKKLGPCGDYIETVRGVGYRFKEKP